MHHVLYYYCLHYTKSSEFKLACFFCRLHLMVCLAMSRNNSILWEEKDHVFTTSLPQVRHEYLLGHRVPTR